LFYVLAFSCVVLYVAQFSLRKKVFGLERLARKIGGKITTLFMMINATVP
jgi:hypothetical protein